MARRRNSFGSATPFSASVMITLARASLSRSSCRNFSRRPLGRMTVHAASNTRTNSDGGHGFPLWVMVDAPGISWSHAFTHELATGQNRVDTLTRFGKRFIPHWMHYPEACEPHDREIGSPRPNSKKPRVVVVFSFDPISTVISSSFHLAPLAPRL